ncbi:sugar ABC transporter substrate-binding protein [Cohnella sp. GCM10027633]|uniref:sugar ABC transporter substrate-binding protein n=1 Tax=unclassified Cohnella TaxID=2636738 RepID=UPI003640F906
MKPVILCKRRRAAPLLLLALALLLVTGGCYKGAGGSGGAEGSAAAPAGGTSSPPPAASGLTFGIVYPMAHPFYEMITEYAKEAAARQGVRLLVKAPDEANLEQQIRMVETMIKQKVEGIAIDPVDERALAPVIDKAAQAGIPVVCFESDSPTSGRLSYIGADNRQAGERMGKLLDGLLEGKGMVIVETGMAGMANLKDRLDGLLGYLNRETDIQVIEVRYNEGKEAAALSHLEAMIEAHPHFDAFVALDVMSSSASVLVWKASGLNRYALSFGMMPDIRQALDNGQMTAVVSHNEELWGERIVSRLLEASRGEAIPAFDDMGTTEVQR